MGGRILIIDDEIEMCEVLKDGLEQRGFEVTARTSPTQAFAILMESRFDAAITDLNMREMNGFCCASGSRRTGPTFRSS